MKESTIQKKILDYLNGLPHCTAYKIAQGPYSQGGILDIVCCKNGFFLAIEVKRQGGKATKKQLKRVREIKEAQGQAIIADCIEDAVKIIAFIYKDKNILRLGL